MKVCRVCNLEKPFEEFREIKRKFTENGKIYFSRKKTCKKCENKVHYQNRKENPEYKKQVLVANKKFRKSEKRKSIVKKYCNKVEIKLKRNLSRRIHYSVKNLSNSSSELLGCSIEYFKKYIENLFSDGMNWDNYGLYGWHIDHILPVSAFCLENSEERDICFHYTNLRPLWSRDNLAKSNKIL